MPNTTFSGILKRYFKDQGVPPYIGCERLGMGQAAAYKYLAGESLPQNCRIKHLAMCLGYNEKRLRRVITQERAEMRKSGAK